MHKGEKKAEVTASKSYYESDARSQDALTPEERKARVNKNYENINKKLAIPKKDDSSTMKIAPSVDDITEEPKTVSTDQFNVDKVIASNVLKTIEDFDPRNTQTLSIPQKRNPDYYRGRRVSKKYRKLVEAAEALRRKRNTERKLGRLFGAKETVSTTEYNDLMREVNFESPLVLSLDQ